jgi:protoheme IX farnesyltransferase
MRLKNLTLFNIVMTFCLIMWGAVVHNTQSSLACPDWPLCYDQVFPNMEGAILIEHGHRLLASFVGFLTVLMAIFSFIERKKSDKHQHLFKASLMALFLVIAQGALGGITVIYKLPTIASTSHLGLALFYFSFLVYIHHQASALTQSSITLSEELKKQFKKNWKPFIRHGVLLSLALLYSQILLGAFMRHAGAGAACGVGSKSALLCMDVSNWALTFWPSLPTSQLHMIHRYYGVLVFLVVAYFSIKTFIFFKGNLKLRIASLLPFAFISLQVLFGVLTVWLNFAVVPTTLHLAGAALSLIAVWKLNLLVKDIEAELFDGGSHSFLSDVVDLTKPRLSLLVMVTALVGTLIAPDKINFFKALLAFFLTTLVVIGAAALNCYMEREIDAKMHRTKDRPLPAKRMKPLVALIFGIVLLLVSIPLLGIFINGVTAILAFVAAALYLYAYTPMKQKSELAVYVGAIPGAIPPVMGWTAVTGQIDVMAVTLFLILFVWQLPHFLSISLYHAEDYGAASIKIYPNLKRGVVITKLGIFVFTAFLFVTSLLPSIFSHASFVYTRSALVLSGAFLLYSSLGFFIKQDKEKERQWARNYFYGSLFYLPLLLLALIFFK